MLGVSVCKYDRVREVSNTAFANRRVYRADKSGDKGFYKSEKKELEDRLILLRGQFEDQESANKRQRQLLEKYFNFARYAKEDFEGDYDLKKKEVLAIIGQNLLFKDGSLEFEPIKYLTPLVEKYPALEKQYLQVQTYPERVKKEAVASIISSWYARRDSNPRPLVPETNALSS